MTTQIRTWQDSDFYLSSAGTANVREQIIKTQSISKLVRALSDASTVDTNGDKLQDRLLGLSLGDLTQRHKYRVIYDNLNDRFLVQRNSGTDASKVWVELLRLDASGNLTVVGNFSQDLIETDTGEVVLGSTLNVNDFYIRNIDKNIGEFRTDDLLVHDATTLNEATITSLTVPTSAGFQVGSNDATPFPYTYAINAANQAIVGGVNTNLTSLTGLTLPNTSGDITTRSFLVRFNVTVVDTSGVSNSIPISLYNGPNGNSSDTKVYQAGGIGTAGFAPGVISGLYRLTPGASDRTKIGLTCGPTSACTVFGESNIFATIYVTEIP